MRNMTDDKLEIYSRLSYFAQNGIALYVGDQAVTPEEAMRCYELHEDHVYMPDYVFNEQGILRELRYDKVTKQE